MLLNGHIACKIGFEYRRFFNATCVSPGIGQSTAYARSLTSHIWTFDDALEDISNIYFNYFKSEGKVFHFFVCPHLVDNWECGKYDYVRSKLGNKNANMLNWSKIQQLQEAGNIIGSHGLDHESFSNMSENQMIDQLEQSKELIFKRTGFNSDSFAFPYGKVSNSKLNGIKIARNSYNEVYLSDNSQKIGELSDGVYNRRHCEFGSCSYRGLLIGYLNVIFGLKKWQY